MSDTELLKRRSTLDKVRLAAEIVLAYARVRRSLRRRTLTSIVAELRAARPASALTAPVPEATEEEARLSRAVIRVLRRLPSGSQCLLRSLVLLEVLARRGVHSELVIAVQPMERAEDVGLDAHAWIEVGGRPLLAPALDYGRLVTL
jgi:hypothetical protein